MATFTFRPVPAWGAPGDFARIGTAKSRTFPVTIPAGTPATVVQGGLTKVGYVESDANGLIAQFTTTDIPSVVVDFGFAQLTVHSLEAITAGAASAAAAAASATTASGYATAAATSAASAASAATTAAAAAVAPLSTQVTGLTAQQTALEQTTLGIDEIAYPILIPSWGTTPAAVESSGVTHTIWIAPFSCTVTGFIASFDYWNFTANDTNYWSIDLTRSRAGTTATMVTKTTKTPGSGGEGVTARRPWDYAGQTWNTTNAQMVAGDLLLLRTGPTGTPANLQLPLTGVLRVIPA